MIYKIKCEILKNNIAVGELDILNGTITFDSNAEVKKAAQISVSAAFKMYKIDVLKSNKLIYPNNIIFPSETTFLGVKEYIKNSYEFDVFKDRVKINIIEDGVKKTLGIFMIVSSPLTKSGNQKTYNLEMYDETMVLKQSTLDERKYFASGTLYSTVLQNLILDCGLYNILMESCDYKLKNDKEYSIGDNVLEIVNELLLEIGYKSIYVDDNGFLRMDKMSNKNYPDFIYNQYSKILIKNSYTLQQDIYNIPNVFIGIVSNPENEVLIYKKVNDDVGSKLSTVSRGIKITKIYNLKDIANEIELKNYIDNEYFKISAVTEVVNIETSIEANHTLENLIQIQIDLSNLIMSHKLERHIYE